MREATTDGGEEAATRRREEKMQGYSIGRAKLREKVGHGNIVRICEVHPWRNVRVEREKRISNPGYKVKNPSDGACEGIDNLLIKISSQA